MHRIVLSLGVLLALAAFQNAAARTAHAASAAAGSGPRILGAWKEAGRNGSVVCFEKARCVVRDRRRTRYFLARYRDDRVEVYVRGEWVPWRFTLEKRTLQLDRGRGPRKLHRLARPPADLEPKPLALGAAGPVPKTRCAEVAADLAHRAAEDQAVRKDRSRMREMPRIDRDNTAWLKKQVAELGWVDARRFGKKAANDAFLIVQHSGDLPLMLAALPGIKKDFGRKLIDGQGYALLYDRLQMRLGRTQRFGSQLETSRGGEMVLYPLENPKRVEAWRKKAGLMPLSRYLALVERQYGRKVKR